MKHGRLLLLCCACVFLTACGKSSAVKEVEKAIDSIGEVNEDSEILISDAEVMYDNLTSEEKKKVENYSTLTEARKKFDEENKPAFIESKLKALMEDNRDFSQNDIEDIINTYDSLTDVQKQKVSLGDSIDNYRDIDIEAVHNVQKKIDDIDESTQFKEIISLFSEVNNLTSKEKKLLYAQPLITLVECDDNESAAIGACNEIKSCLKDSNSFELISQDVVDDRNGSTGYILVKTKYSATNGFGGRVEDTSLMPISSSGKNDFLPLAILSGDVDSALFDTNSLTVFNSKMADKVDVDKISYLLENPSPIDPDEFYIDEDDSDMEEKTQEKDNSKTETTEDSNTLRSGIKINVGFSTKYYSIPYDGYELSDYYGTEDVPYIIVIVDGLQEREEIKLYISIVIDGEIYQYNPDLSRVSYTKDNYFYIENVQFPNVSFDKVNKVEGYVFIEKEAQLNNEFEKAVAHGQIKLDSSVDHR